MTRFLQILFIFFLGLAVNAVVLLEPKAISGPDLRIHYQWTVQFIEALREGIIYPRWAALSNLGLGDPTFIYIHPLFYYSAAAVHKLTGNIWSAILWVPALSNSVAAVIAFISLSRAVNTSIAFAMGVLVALSPYGFHLAHYQQFLPMHFAIYALVLYMVAWALRTGLARMVLLALAVGMLAASHILMAFMVLMVTAPVAVLHAAREAPKLRLRALVGDGLGVALGLSLAGVYLLPALTSQQLISPSGWYQPTYLDWRNSFLFQFFTLPPTGFRWFHLQWTIPALTLAITVFSIFAIWQTRSQKTRVWWLAVDATAITLLALLLGSELSYGLWEHSETLRRLQFPIRFLGVASITSLFGLGYAAPLLLATPRRIWAMAAVVCALLGSAGLQGLLEFKFSQEAQSAPSLSIPRDKFMGQPEMKPAGAGDAWSSYAKAGGLAAECKAQKLACATTLDLTHHKMWAIHATARTASLRLPLLWYPGWEIRVGPQAVPQPKDPASGLVTVQVPPGDTVVEAVWVGLPAQKIGAILSLSALIALCMITLSLYLQRFKSAV
ncbi:hypothetical protein SAMN05216303_1011335 [Rhodoferax sp. OV413]|uniref:6-pyruvoyl-tetrahydropterin synthase-related protein n=1 Tax=Rhodoferax sp. OV413 TaxID=1855285 RepID=UPI00088E37A1|nr:hypothetical protein SAMN05216303_1011335 [Rhodoferax sp. OV413]